MAPWKRGHAQMALRQFIGTEKNTLAGRTDAEHVRAAANWLARAQDATSDGGIVGRYNLGSGWSSSYPETTGYLIPTMLKLAKETEDASWRERARRSVDFLLALQLPEGAFPGAEVHENTTRGSMFNTAQIINGLCAWHAETDDDQTLAALRGAGDWLCSIQDPDGAWRSHNYMDRVTTYTTHASCWLAELGAHLDEERYLDAAVRHMDWALTYRDTRTGWIDLAGFAPVDHEARRAVTHTIAYTLSGILTTALLAGRSDAVEAVRKAAIRIARRIQLSGWLPGELDSDWKAAADYACLTGNAQMALIWLRLYKLDGDGRLLNAALLSLDRVKERQDLTNSNPGIHGGIAGSAPVWGDYIRASYPNWAVKFFIDAMYEARDAVSALPARRAISLSSIDVPSAPPTLDPEAAPSPLRVVLLAGAYSHKVAQMVQTWRSWGFRPAAVVVERTPEPPARQRLVKRIRAEGFGWIGSKLKPRQPLTRPRSDDADGWPRDLRAFCASEHIPVIEVESLSSSAGVSALRSTEPDLAIHAGAGIIRRELLEIPRLGVLNAHMGVLPFYRGMNVAEWAMFNRDAPGCTVHLIDPGIDTGDILCARTVSVDGADSLQKVRRLVDQQQIALLGEVVRYVLCARQLPPRRTQKREEGRQYFQMHPLIRARLDHELIPEKSTAS